MINKIENNSKYIYVDAIDRVFIHSNKYDKLQLPVSWPIYIYESKDWPLSGIYYVAICLASLNWNENLSKEETKELLLKWDS